ncbi:type 1 glutamine amidotransferase domain-containing protein [Photobacterium sp. OFAV2-7]|uniref:type 1 glutamine amidotransferase domain-containing protein n=1 Tax=Photobacterium sp. OFAV2-7 TaxID=2917748 RepID=UPI001EF72B40|nr:type 1 glutamine amidotransferase domain-containing protein [Photobacterium sp. OFAV2-7]MCG7587434.1 type 1 glutamine amidotransferase domain-containing protein [Photobacterium sp. OFAV2-7]
MTHFYDELEKEGIHIDIVSPKGGKVPIDGRSLGRFTLDKASKKRYEDREFMALLEDTKPLSTVDWRDFDILYFAGGHGAMWDFSDNGELHTLTRKMYEDGKIISAVCHGVAGNSRLIDEKRLLMSRMFTVWQLNYQEALS